uniref:Heat shock protein 70 n=1 Tax=Micromonas pusilla TaxID=38833 RepID=A0A7S0KSF1_MICPS
MPSGRDARTGAVASSSSSSASSRLSARRRLAPARPRPRPRTDERARGFAKSPRRGRALRVTTRAASICGIDLGTTNSAVAIVVDGKPVIVADARGNRTIPSVVSFAPDGSVLVGHDARRRLAKDPANTFSSVKRFIGKRFDSKTVKDDAQRVPYEVIAAPDGGVALRCPALGASVTVTPVDVSRHILSTLLATAEDGAGVNRGDIKRAVVTVPAYFDDAQCAATIEAGKLAGLEKVKLLHEPVAAALAYGVDVERDETIFVFDLGGGTFDVSVLEVGGGTVEVLATGGDAHLGGDDLDRALAVWLAKEAKSLPGGLSVEIDPRGALMAARRARERLSEAMEVEIPMPGGAVKTLTRPLLEKVCARVLRSMRLPVEIAADSAGINLEALQAAVGKGGKGIKNKRTLARRGGRPFDHILLVGGATKTPAVRRLVENTFGRKPRPGLVNPDEVVALGAAVHAGSLEGLLAETETLGPMQASLIRAFASKMRRERGEEAFEDLLVDADDALFDDSFDEDDQLVWTEEAMARSAAAAGLDLLDENDDDDDDDWGPEDLNDLLRELEDEFIEEELEELDELSVNKDDDLEGGWPRSSWPRRA